ncbi:hypothetical protein JCM11251_006421 [Rhodosporidiobolus azoricus]
MSYASIAKQGSFPEELQAKPDPTLLTSPADAHPRAPSPGGSAEADFEADKVAVVDRDEIEKLRQAMEHADEAHIDADFEEARRHQQERDTAEQQARLKAQAQTELKHEVDKVEPIVAKTEQKGEELKNDAKQKGKEVEKEVKQKGREVEQKGREVEKEVKQKGKEVEKEVKEKWAEGKKEAKEFADKAEKEVKKDAKKLQKKASEVEKEGRALAKQYPYAASGIVGLVNLTLIAVPAYFAYKNWHQPRWDRRIVSAVAVGLTAAFGAESALGWFEYQQEQKGR